MNSRPEVLFDGIADRLVLEISKAKSSIYVAVAWLSNENLFDALVAKAKQGVMVRLMISNDEQTQKNSQKLDYKILNGIGDSDVSLVKPEMGGLMHNKLCIIDRLTVITGSYNWTYYADNKNHENVFIFQDKEVAEACIKYFKEIISHYLNANPPKPKSPHSTQNETQSQNPQHTQNDKKSPPPKSEHQSPKNSHSSNNQRTKEQVANDYLELANQYRAKHIYKLAFENYQKSAQMGNVEAQYWLGYCYEHEEGTERNMRKAVEWYKESAQMGNSNAQYRLGFCCYYGKGVERDEEKAVMWYTRSAEQNNVEAQYKLGFCYEYGRGGEKNPKKAFEWFQKLAKQGYVHAQWRVAFAYQWGKGVEKDATKAIEWYKKSAIQGYGRSIETLKEDFNIYWG